MIYRYAGLSIDTASRLVADGEQAIDVPRRVFDCLAMLIEQRERAVGRDELTRAIWNRDNVSDTQLAQTILLVRRLLRDDGVEQRAIRTVPGFGYHFVGAIEVQEAAATILVVEGAPIPTAFVRVLEPTHVPDAVVKPVVALADSAGVSAASTGRTTRPHFPRRTWISVAAVLAAAVATGFAIRAYRPAMATLADNASPHVVVLPVRVRDEDQIGWARLGVMDMLAVRLRQQGMVVPPSENVLAATVNVDYATKRPFGDALVLQASAARLASGWEVDLNGVREHGLPVHVSGRHAELVAAAAQAADAFLVAMGRTPTGDGGLANEPMQRIRAALLGNELDTLRELLARLPPALRDGAEARYLSAELDYRLGRLEVSREALDRLLDDGKESTNPLLHSRILVARGSLFLRLHDDDAAERDFSAAVSALDGIDASRELGRALMGRACIAMRRQHDDAAKLDLDRARMLLDAAGDDVGMARTDVNLGLIERRAGRPLEALAHLSAAALRFESYAAVNELSVALANIADVQRTQLRWDDAQVTSERAAILLPRLPDPHLRARLQRARAEVLLGRGKLHEADAVLSELVSGDATATPADRAATSELSGESALLRGDAALAIREADAALAYVAVHRDDHDSDDLADAAWLLRTRAAMLRGGANALPASTMPTVDASSTAQLARGLWLHAQREDTAAEAALRAALTAAQSDNNAMQTRDASDALVAVLLEQGRGAEALEAAANIAAYASGDFDSAVTLARVHAQDRFSAPGRSALDHALALAGERLVPPELLAFSTTQRVKE